MFLTYLYADDFVQLSPLPILVNNEIETFKISSSVTIDFQCNHEEADTRIFVSAFQQKANVILSLKDTDVLVLMIFGNVLRKINENKVMKTESKKFIIIRKIV